MEANLQIQEANGSSKNDLVVIRKSRPEKTESFGDIYLRKHKGFDGLYSDRPIEELVGEELVDEEPTSEPGAGSKTGEA